MSNDFCATPTDFPLTKHGQMIFQEVIRNVVGDNVLDLGCGSVGHYWALGYMGRVKSITCVDYSESSIAALSSTLATLTPDFLQSYYEDTIHFLQTEQLIDPVLTYDELAEQLIMTCTRVLAADFRQDFSFLGTFDCVLGLEAIECVDTPEEFLYVVQNIHRLLTPQGIFVGIVTPYDTKDAYTQMFIEQGVEGNLNPQLADIEAAFLHADFQHVHVKAIATHIYNYSQSLVIYASKGASSS